MVIMTAKVPKRRLLLIVLLLIAAAVVLALCLHGAGSETEKPTKSSAQGATNEARIAFLMGNRVLAIIRDVSGQKAAAALFAASANADDPVGQRIDS